MFPSLRDLALLRHILALPACDVAQRRSSKPGLELSILLCPGCRYGLLKSGHYTSTYASSHHLLYYMAVESITPTPVYSRTDSCLITRQSTLPRFL